MKKLLFTFGIVFLFVNVFGELPKTKTIGVDTLIVIRNACKDPSQGGDDLIHHYYMEYKGESLREEGEAEEIIEDGRLRATFKTESYMKYAFLGVIDVELEVEDPDDYLSFASRFLLDPTFPDDPQYPGHSYLSIADVIDSLEEEPEGDAAYGLVDVFSLAYTLNNLAMIVDMLWYYENGDYREELAAKLDSIAYFAKEIVDNTEFGAYDYYVYGDPDETEIIDIVRFSPGYDNRRLLLLGALGYAGCVLENREYINRVDWELLERGMTDTDIVGLLDHLTQDSGIYAEGLAYRSFSLQGLTNYFTARNRLNNLEILENLDHGVFNYYNEVHIRKMFEESFFLLCPDLTFTTFEDCRKLNIKRSDGLNPQNIKNNNYFPFGMFEYYYQQTDQTATELLSHIEFYLNESYSNHDSYPTLLFSSYIRPLLYSYSANGNLLHEDPVIPARFQEPNYSNEEFTVLRDTISTSDEFRENLAVWVNHENYDSHNIGHEHGDQTSFTLYYEGRNYKNL